jgi:hypothetical protein
MDELKVGDVVWHTKKNYIGKIKRKVGNEHKDLFIEIIVGDNISNQKGFTVPTNQSKVRKDRLGQLLYG